MHKLFSKCYFFKYYINVVGTVGTRAQIHIMWIVFLVFIFIDRHTYCAGHSGHMGTFIICLILCAGYSGRIGSFFDSSYILQWAQWAHGHTIKLESYYN